MAKKRRKKNPKGGIPWWAWLLGSIGLGGVAILLLSSGSSSASGGSPAGADSRLFDAFWMTAGREESRNQLDDWRAVDLGGGAGGGWLHFNQKFSLPDVFRKAAEYDQAQWASLMGGYADSLADPSQAKSMNLNAADLQPAILAFLRSPLGEWAQKQIAYDQYFVPALEALASAQPNADDVYKAVVAATRVWTSEISNAMANSATAEDFVNYLIQNPISKDPGGTIAQQRMPRQLQNARSMLSTGQLAIS